MTVWVTRGEDGWRWMVRDSRNGRVGAGVFECKIDFGPGYRVYFGKDGEEIVILLGGGTKQRQQNDIQLALGHWEDYKQRKRKPKEGE
jgi:putative addiction module killer protein